VAEVVAGYVHVALDEPDTAGVSVTACAVPQSKSKAIIVFIIDTPP
jgi:hypothetical protein